jgi:hypothetical protein
MSADSRRRRRVDHALAAGLVAISLTVPLPALADGAILVVSAAEGPMPAPELERRIQAALDAAAVQYAETDLAFLTQRAARGLGANPPARLRVCVPSGSPCLTLVRQ